MPSAALPMQESSTVNLACFEVKGQICTVELVWGREAMETLGREAFELRGKTERFRC